MSIVTPISNNHPIAPPAAAATAATTTTTMKTSISPILSPSSTTTITFFLDKIPRGSLLSDFSHPNYQGCAFRVIPTRGTSWFFHPTFNHIALKKVSTRCVEWVAVCTRNLECSRKSLRPSLHSSTHPPASAHARVGSIPLFPIT